TGRFDGVVDLSPDFVYQSHGHLTDWGYEVEVRIPFKSLRYQSVDPQSWGLQVVRVVQHSGYEDTWTPVFRASASFLIQSARLTGKLGSTAVAYLGAVDDRGQSASGNNPVFNLLRLRRDLGTASTAGLVYTDRIEGDDYNRVLGGDAMVVWKKIWFSQAQVV